jgi:hypothetical protein
MLKHTEHLKTERLKQHVILLLYSMGEKHLSLKEYRLRESEARVQNML